MKTADYFTLMDNNRTEWLAGFIQQISKHESESRQSYIESHTPPPVQNIYYIYHTLIQLVLNFILFNWYTENLEVCYKQNVILKNSLE